MALTAAMFIGLSKTAIGGLGMVSVVLFANFVFPEAAKASSGFVLPLLICGDVVAVKSYRAHTQWQHLGRLFPWAGLGILGGWLAMGRIDNRQASLLIGGIVIVMVAIHLWRRRSKATAKGPGGEEVEMGYAFAAFIGVMAGVTTLVANAAGPLMAIYLLSMRLPKMEFMGTGAVFFFLINCFKVPFMVNLELITWESAKGNLLLAPAVFVGALIGRKILPKIDQRLFENLALWASALAGMKLLF
ncbi:sulfite exporter TauE/SafE family protein [Actomonas aquatica]|uniref:Probable membrane transporter protein n=1 Tax=Actomonas aquatica TaxID=2866162 RepID=A0ABZ1CD99_9BACT|nr:sulfite exporter TauE/SafE family protein [Opitutus sp. WL0086]WRQ89345.1 sulfite exporter TauE/SafE family protein [Opitutus sp. WL0086]